MRLRQELSRRTAANPKYSMRSFARSLEVSPSQLSDVLGGRKRMSDRTQERVAKKLGWKQALKTVKKSPSDVQSLNWWHLAILQLANHERLLNDPAGIAARLGLSNTAVAFAIRDLVDRGLVTKLKGVLKPIPDRLFFGDQTPSEAIRDFHKETLKLAARQIELTNFEDREFSFSIWSLSREAAQKLRMRIREVVEELADEASRSEGIREIFGFGIQLYKISNSKL